MKTTQKNTLKITNDITTMKNKTKPDYKWKMIWANTSPSKRRSSWGWCLAQLVRNLYPYSEGCWFESQDWQNDAAIGSLCKACDPLLRWVEKTVSLWGWMWHHDSILFGGGGGQKPFGRLKCLWKITWHTLMEQMGNVTLASRTLTCYLTKTFRFPGPSVFSPPWARYSHSCVPAEILSGSYLPITRKTCNLLCLLKGNKPPRWSIFRFHSSGMSSTDK